MAFIKSVPGVIREFSGEEMRRLRWVCSLANGAGNQSVNQSDRIGEEIRIDSVESERVRVR